jgi:hypothetical protein
MPPGLQNSGLGTHPERIQTAAGSERRRPLAPDHSAGNGNDLGNTLCDWKHMLTLGRADRHDCGLYGINETHAN